MKPSTLILLSSFSPLHLFRSGANGWWYDPSDFSTMFQDSAGTTPVTAVGQQVGRHLDKSGRGNHRVQATDANRPTLGRTASGIYYLDYDGTNDALATAAAVDFTGTDKVTLFAGITKSSDAATQIFVETSANWTSNNGAFAVIPLAAGVYGARSRGTGSATANTAGTYTAPRTDVLTFVGNIATDTCLLRVNGVQAASDATDQGTGNYGNHVAYFGSRAGTSVPFTGREFQNICVGKLASETELVRAERWMNARTGA